MRSSLFWTCSWAKFLADHHTFLFKQGHRYLYVPPKAGNRALGYESLQCLIPTRKILRCLTISWSSSPESHLGMSFCGRCPPLFRGLSRKPRGKPGGNTPRKAPHPEPGHLEGLQELRVALDLGSSTMGRYIHGSNGHGMHWENPLNKYEPIMISTGIPTK